MFAENVCLTGHLTTGLTMRKLWHRNRMWSCMKIMHLKKTARLISTEKFIKAILHTNINALCATKGKFLRNNPAYAQLPSIIA